MMKTVHFYYFSGTGNTLLAVKKMQEVFESHKIKVCLHPIEKTNPKNIDLSDTIGLAFPVAVQGTYPFIWDFIKHMPQTKNTPVFMADTLAEFSGGIVGPVGHILKKKGYKLLGAEEIIMPSNLFPKKIQTGKIEKGLNRAAEYAEALLTKQSKWGRWPVLSDFMSLFSRSKLLWRLFRKIFYWKVDKDKCTKCGLCVQLCPVGNIRLDDYPQWSAQCVFCMRCFSFCPVQAIYYKKGWNSYKAVNADKILSKADNSCS